MFMDACVSIIPARGPSDSELSSHACRHDVQCLALPLRHAGGGIGYFLFGWRRAVIADANEHCH